MKGVTMLNFADLPSPAEIPGPVPWRAGRFASSPHGRYNETHTWFA
jgi:hypothetical protein